MVSLVQDPYWETADIDTSNNAWPRRITPSRLELFKQDRDKDNLMKDFSRPLKPAEKAPEAKRAGRKAGFRRLLSCKATRIFFFPLAAAAMLIRVSMENR